MIVTEPRFMIFYVPPLLSFGGIRFDYSSYDSSKFNEEVSDTVSSIGQSIERAYEVKTRIKSVDNYSLLTRVSPLVSELDKKSAEVNIKDIDMNVTKYIKSVSRKMVDNKKTNAIITRDYGFDVFHILEEKFNPENTENLLSSIQSLLFDAGGRIYDINSYINGVELSIDLKLKKPSEVLYIV